MSFWFLPLLKVGILSIGKDNYYLLNTDGSHYIAILLKS